MITVQVTSQEWTRALEQYRREEKKDLGQILRQQGRLLAVQLALITRPSGKSMAVRDRQRKSIEADVLRGLWSYERLAEKLGHAGTEWTKRVTAAAKAGDAEALRALFDGSSWAPIAINPAVDTEKALSIRDPKTGKSKRNIPISQKQIVTAANSITNFAKKRSAKGGIGKGGWAGAAVPLGGTRGIPAWVNKHSKHGTAVDRAAKDENPYVVLRNNVRYILTICDEAQVKAATVAQQNNFIKFLEHRKRGRKRKL
jgi:hypothetical protein